MDGNSIPQNTSDTLAQTIATLAGGSPLDLGELDRAGMVPTETVGLIWRKLAFAVNNNVRFVLIHGPAGVGKTESVVEFCRDPRKALAKIPGGMEVPADFQFTYMQVKPETDASAFIFDLAQTLKTSNTHTMRYLITIVREYLSANPRLIVLDEVQRMNRNALDVAKYMADATGSTFALIMTDEFVSRIRRWRDIESRIGVVVQVVPASAEEVIKIYSHRGWKKTTLRRIHSLTGGIMRDVVRLIALLEKAASLSGVGVDVFEPHHAEAAAKELYLGDKTR
ncbi:MAG: AAA family ATPase [Meiothermus ruber]|uniref:AAA family ATPase n=1 Tax=Meiothermus ruber TaxID=277 RepID=UPI0023F7457A|nr:AAA family ATPase [Meiothermus ruber]MCL6529666.1 AAA family ATPase [Meiothermus ruber]